MPNIDFIAGVRPPEIFDLTLFPLYFFGENSMTNPFIRTSGTKISVTKTAQTTLNAQSLESLEKRYVFDVAVADTIEHIVNSHGLTPSEASHPAQQGEGLVAAARSISSSPDLNAGHVAAASWLDAQVKNLENQFSVKSTTSGLGQGVGDTTDRAQPGSDPIAPTVTPSLDSATNSHVSADSADKSSLLNALNHAAPVNALHDVVPTQVAFIDGSLPDYQTIVKDLPSGVTAVIIDPNQDGVTQISAYLNTHTGVGAIHLVGHGSPGDLHLGTSELNSASISGIYNTALKSIGAHMVAGGDILIYGCDFASGANGAQAESLLASVTGKNIAAADHLVGAADLGASWTLDKTTGHIDVASIQALDWNHDLLAIPAGSVTVAAGQSIALTIQPQNASTEIVIAPTSTGPDKAGIPATTTFTYTDQNGATQTVSVGSDGNWHIPLSNNGGTNPHAVLDAKGNITGLTIAAASGSTNGTYDYIVEQASTTNLLPVDANNNIFGTADTTGNNFYNLSTVQPTASTNFTLAATGTIVTDGKYAVVNTVPADYGWDTTIHDPAGGNILVINGIGAGLTEYTQNISVNPGQDYNFSINIANIMPKANHANPNATLEIIDGTGKVIASLNTGDIPYSASNPWSNFNLNFNAGTNSTLTFAVIDNVNIITSGPNANATIGVQPVTSVNPLGLSVRGNDYALSDLLLSQLVKSTNVSMTIGQEIAINHTYSTPYGTPLTIGNAATGDTYPPNSTFSTASTPSHGAVTMNPDGTYTYTPAAGFVGTDTFNYTITDPSGQTVTATETINIAPPAPPVAIGHTYSDAYNTPLTTGNAATGDTFAAGSTFAATSTPAHGAVTMNPDGTYTYTPLAGFAGKDTFTYKVTDPAGQTSTATETINIAPPAISAINDAYTTPYNTALTTGNAATGDTFSAGSTFATTTNPAHGTVVMNADGTYTYTPTVGYFGTDTFTYKVTDPSGQSSTATETITVSPPVTVLTAVNDTTVTLPNTPLSSTLVPHTADSFAGATLTFALGTTTPQHGTLVFNPDGTYQYTPALNYTGTDTFSYSVTDQFGKTTTATETILIQKPTLAAGNDVKLLAANTALNSTLVPYVSDTAAAPALTFTTVLQPTHGTVTLNANGSFSYVPTTNFTGTDVFTYQVKDQFGNAVTATETIVIQPPSLTAVSDVYSMAANTVLAGNAASNDTYAPGSQFAALSNPSHGTVTMNTDGTYTYTPAINYVGTDSFAYMITDPTGAQRIATETITVTAPPLNAVNDTYSIPYNTALNGAAGANDAFAPGSIFVSTSSPSHGTVAMNTDGTYTYTPTTNFAGVDSFTYKITDPLGRVVTATENITITPPTIAAVSDSYSMPYNTVLSGNAASGDTYATGSTFSTASNPSHGVVTMKADGTYNYVPATNFIGTDSFTYKITDPTGQTVTATENITITPPLIAAVSDSYTTSYNTALSGNAASGDTYATGSTFAATSAPAHGVVTMKADGTYNYTPAANFAGVDTFSYKITDPTGQTVTATETITVLAPALNAVNDSFSTAYKTPVSGNAAAGDTYAKGSVFAATSSPAHGTLSFNADGTYSYTPAAGYVGTDTFTYKITDPTGQTVTATETITIAPPALSTIDHTVNAAFNTPLNGNAAAGDTFTPGSTFAPGSTPAHGTVTMNPDGTYTYTPTPGFIGTDTFTYKITDPTGAVSIATETINVGVPALAAQSHTLTTAFNTPLTTGNASLGDTYFAGSSFATTSVPAHGTVTMNPDGTYIYTPSPNFVGSDTFTYKVTDPTGQVAMATETVKVLPPPPPTAINDKSVLKENTSISGTIAGDISEPVAGLPVTFTVSSTTAHGTLTINPNGTFNYVPNNGFAGTDSFVYKVSDGLGGSATATMFITVTPDASTPQFKCLTTFENYASLNLFPV